MPTPGTADLTVYQGDDYALECSFTTSSGAYNLTGLTFKAEVRTTNADDDAGGPPLATFTPTITDAPGGILTLTLPHTATLGLPALAAWDLQSTNGTGWVTTYLKGKVTTTKEVTR